MQNKLPYNNLAESSNSINLLNTSFTEGEDLFSFAI